MSNLDQDASPQEPQRRARPAGGTEYSWCKAVPTGTGITVLALHLSKHPDIQLIQDALQNLQMAHPIVRSRLLFNASTNTFSIVIPPSPHIQIQFFDLSSTAGVIAINENPSVDSFHLVVEQEMNKNSWSVDTDCDVFFASLYTLSDTRWAVVLRLHTSVCDRASAVTLLRELRALMGREGGGQGIQKEGNENYVAEVCLGIENLIPSGKANKSFWARGADLLGYSLNSFRLANLDFVDADWSTNRYSQVVRLQLNPEDSKRLLSMCKSRGIKLCGALAAAGLIAAHSCKDLPGQQWRKYGVITLVDCRSILDPVLSPRHIGFYHSAILNTHDVSGGQKFWELAKRCYMAFANAKNDNKHFSDMGDLNFLMCKAIENPGLTPSSSMRTAFMSLFEDPVVDESNTLHGKLGLEDYVECSSVHGVGPSIALFHAIRDGQLDCACVYPSPLHSRTQMQKLIDDMRRILVDSYDNVEDES